MEVSEYRRIWRNWARLEREAGNAKLEIKKIIVSIIRKKEKGRKMRERAQYVVFDSRGV